MPGVEPDLDDVAAVRPLAAARAYGFLQYIDALAHLAHEEALAASPVTEQANGDGQRDVSRYEDGAQSFDVRRDAQAIGPFRRVGVVARDLSPGEIHRWFRCEVDLLLAHVLVE